MNSNGGSTDQVTVYSPEESCQQCKATVRALDARGITHRVIKVAENDDDTRDKLRSLGFMQFPVVWAPTVGYWAGFRPDKIDDLASIAGGAR
ncbi:MAG: glutaredoxin domain-containing protein [Microbacterium sp.]|uniref:glutaredoxin domain-containing protein n=1 Tax=Microbacterium sp. TaxID=51671 RepID=UPI003F95E5BA